MRAFWKGSISFGLVHIPVSLYPTTQGGHEVKFRLLRDADHSPIRYKRVAEADDKEVGWDHIVKGYEHSKGEFVVLNRADFESINLTSTKTVEIQEFVPEEEIDPIFYETSYFLVPEKGGAKAYALLRDAMKDSGKAGIAKVVLKTREYVAAVKPSGNVLVMVLMHFADELADPGMFPLPEKAEVGKKELEMAKTLMNAMSSDWEPEKYKDDYTEAVMELIEKKLSSGSKRTKTTKAASPPSNVVNLVEILQQSLNKSKGSEKKKGEASPKGRSRVA